MSVGTPSLTAFSAITHPDCKFQCPTAAEVVAGKKISFIIYRSNGDVAGLLCLDVFPPHKTHERRAHELGLNEERYEGGGEFTGEQVTFRPTTFSESVPPLDKQEEYRARVIAALPSIIGCLPTQR